MLLTVMCVSCCYRIMSSVQSLPVATTLPPGYLSALRGDLKKPEVQWSCPLASAPYLHLISNVHVLVHVHVQLIN